MKQILLLLVIVIGVYGDEHLNLDSAPLLEAVKGFLEKALKTMDDIPALKERALSNYTRNVKESLGAYVNCPGVQTLKRNLQSVSNNSVEYYDMLICNGKLDRGIDMIDNTYNKAVRDQIETLFTKINNLNDIYKPKINKIKDALSNYVVKYEPCTIEELTDETCGALVNFEKVLQLYRIKIHDYTVDLTLAASFVGKFADNAWATVEQHLKDEVIEPVNDCIDEYNLDTYFINVSH